MRYFASKQGYYSERWSFAEDSQVLLDIWEPRLLSTAKKAAATIVPEIAQHDPDAYLLVTVQYIPGKAKPATEEVTGAPEGDNVNNTGTMDAQNAGEGEEEPAEPTKRGPGRPPKS